MTTTTEALSPVAQAVRDAVILRIAHDEITFIEEKPGYIVIGILLFGANMLVTCIEVKWREIEGETGQEAANPEFERVLGLLYDMVGTHSPFDTATIAGREWVLSMLPQ
jgi:hypothetical protein